MNYPPPPIPSAMQRPGAFPPSPPHSIPRLSNGNGKMPSPPSNHDSGKHPIHVTEENLQEHHRTLSKFLASTAPPDQENSEPHYRARDKLLRLSSVQFQELSTDVFDELLRRENERRHPPHPSDQNFPRFLQPKPNYHPKRNQARQKLATLVTHRFRELAGDVSFELERRYPQFAGANYRASPSEPQSRSNPGSMRTPSNPRLRGAPSNPSLRTTPSNPSLRTPASNSHSGRTRARSSSRSGPRMPAPLPAYVQGLRRPSVNTSPNPNYGTPTPIANHNNPVSPISPYSPTDGYINGSSPYQANDYGRTIPKDFHTPTSAKSKVSAVDEMDEANDGNVSESDYGPDRNSRRDTNKSLPFSMEPTAAPISTVRMSELEQKVHELEGQLQHKTSELAESTKLQMANAKALEEEKRNSTTLTMSLETRLATAEQLNSSLQSELSHLRATNTRLLATPPHDDANCLWHTRFQSLKQDYDDQQSLTDQVRQDAAQNLQELRRLAEESAHTMDREETLQQQVTQLESSVADWKGRYTKAKAQLRNLRAISTPFLPGTVTVPGSLTDRAGAETVTDPNGLVKDTSVTQYQIAVDELLQITHSGDPTAVLDYMRTIVASVRAVTEDIVSAIPASSTSATPTAQIMPGPFVPSTSSSTADSSRRHSKLKSRVSAAANNLITAAKNYSSSQGLSPVSLVDAAANNLTAAVVELVKEVKVRPTPRGELEAELARQDAMSGGDMVIDDRKGFAL